MPNTILIGAQWGDEGKGKVIDVLTAQADVIVRYQGGSNAGHTVITEGKKYVLHLIPSGILHEGKQCVIANGVVMDPFDLIKEIEMLRGYGINPDGRLFISDRTHMVMQWHRAIDKADEARRSIDQKIGTTGRGIGPAYSAKMGRLGFRVGDLLSPDFLLRVRETAEATNVRLRKWGTEILDVEELVREYTKVIDLLRPYITDTVVFLNNADRAGKSILLEGAQGTMLDIDFGTYPYVTSSSPTAGGACAGSGLSPRRIDRVVGVIKCYTTRVGSGPFPTELLDATGEHLRQKGGEFGATTGRPRRCGWFDAVVARYTAMVNGVDFWAMTKLDVLDETPSIKICVAYRRDDGHIYETFPADLRALDRCTPVYEEMPGWLTDTSKTTHYDDLPMKAKAYVERLVALSGARLGILSVGPARETTLRLGI
ncbi:MAG: adenylosuccinate synthase [bacterium]